MLNHFFRDHSSAYESHESRLAVHYGNNSLEEKNWWSIVMGKLISRIGCTIFVNPVSSIYPRTVEDPRLSSSVKEAVIDVTIYVTLQRNVKQFYASI